ncbi:MAG TPA: hypothetical protein VK088_06085 [Acidimicrobiia bacterium]|nr:hypothetical protein [Acidimicrobiia bacterium]
MRRHPFGALVVALLLLVAACGGGGGAATSDGGPSSSTPATDPADDADNPSGGGEESLAAFFGWGDEDPEAAQARFQDQEARVQESIRQCMAEQGFEYQPIVYPDVGGRIVDDFDQEEWARTHGFGITTWYGNEDEMMGEAEEWIDPNQDMLETMSDGERQAWEEALWGTQEEQEAEMEVEIDEETGETIYMSYGHGPGCQGEAYDEVYGDANETQALWEQLQPAMDEMYQRVEADPRLVEANEAWSACMAEAGYELASRNDMWETVHQDFQERLDAILGPDGGWADPFADWTEDEINAFFEEKSQEEIDAFFKEAEEKARENVDMDAVRALQQEEIDMAVADFECARAQDLDELWSEVSVEYEADLIAANRDILEQIREAEKR